MPVKANAKNREIPGSVRAAQVLLQKLPPQSPASCAGCPLEHTGPSRPGCFFFVVAPFCSCPASLVSRKFFAVGPGCAKCFFLLRSVGRRDLSAGPEQTKKTPPRVFFFCSGPGERQGKEKPRAGTGPGWCFFFCSGPVPAPNGASPSPAFPRGRSKKNNTLGGVFFFAAAPRGRSLTHCGPGWRCLPIAGVVFAFFAAGRGRTGVVFFFLLWPRPDAHSLTVGWGDFGKARVVFCFLLRPRRVFLDNNKKCLGYYIGSKKTRRGHSKKKTPLPAVPRSLETQERRQATIGGLPVGSYPTHFFGHTTDPNHETRYPKKK